MVKGPDLGRKSNEVLALYEKSRTSQERSWDRASEGEGGDRSLTYPGERQKLGDETVYDGEYT